MTFLGVGPLELALILILALILVGPEGMVSTAYKMGRWLNRAAHSPLWQEMVKTTHDIQEIPRQIMRETGLSEEMKNMRDLTQPFGKDYLPSESRTAPQFPETQAKPAESTPDPEKKE